MNGDDELPQEVEDAEGDEDTAPEQTDTSDGEVVEDDSGLPLPGSATDA